MHIVASMYTLCITPQHVHIQTRFFPCRSQALSNNIHSNHEKIYEEKPMGTVSVFTTGNYHCKPLMTDVIVIDMTDVISHMQY